MATLTLSIKVKPSAKTSRIERLADGTWRAQLKAPPVDGRANEELVALVAAHFNCRKAAVTIQAGAGGRMKLVKVESS